MKPKLTFSLLQVISIAVATMLLTSAGVLAATGSIDSPAAPGSTNSYTLEDLYQRLANGTAGTQGAFTEPSVAPGTGTMHDLNALMAVAPELDNTNGATAADVLPGQTFWGLTNGEWGVQTGSMPQGSDVTGANGSLTFEIPDGYYSGSMATAQDSNLVPENIAYGVTVFGILGTYHTRFIDNGDGTVTDDFNDKMWTQNANLLGGKRTWNEGVDYCDTLSLAGYKDWRLGTNEDFTVLTTGEQRVRVSTPRAFTGIRSDDKYWTGSIDTTHYYTINLVTGGTGYTNWSNFTYYIWCTRDV
ncbi:DUF1566 domain-containing protein [bacterium]|nr:DUF1566 domain-containing protein [bacterium]